MTHFTANVYSGTGNATIQITPSSQNTDTVPLTEELTVTTNSGLEEIVSLIHGADSGADIVTINHADKLRVEAYLENGHRAFNWDYSYYTTQYPNQRDWKFIVMDTSDNVVATGDAYLNAECDYTYNQVVESANMTPDLMYFTVASEFQAEEGSMIYFYPNRYYDQGRKMVVVEYTGDSPLGVETDWWLSLLDPSEFGTQLANAMKIESGGTYLVGASCQLLLNDKVHDTLVVNETLQYTAKSLNGDYNYNDYPNNGGGGSGGGTGDKTYTTISLDVLLTDADYYSQYNKQLWLFDVASMSTSLPTGNIDTEEENSTNNPNAQSNMMSVSGEPWDGYDSRGGTSSIYINTKWLSDQGMYDSVYLESADQNLNLTSIKGDNSTNTYDLRSMKVAVMYIDSDGNWKAADVYNSADNNTGSTQGIPLYYLDENNLEVQP